MNDLTSLWLPLALLSPIAGAILSKYAPATSRWIAIGSATLSLVAASFAWVMSLEPTGLTAGVESLGTHPASAHSPFIVDELRAPLLCLVALTYLVIFATTVRSKSVRASYSTSLWALGIHLATFSAREIWLLTLLLALGPLPIYAELRARRRPTRVFVWHMGLYVAMLCMGTIILELSGPSLAAVALFTGAALIRCGTAPFHCWMIDLFEHASFGTAMLTCLPMVGTYVVVRFVHPVAPGWALAMIAIASMLTALYAAAMTLVQVEARRLCCFLFLSHSSLVLVGLEVASTEGLAGALCMWFAVSISLTGFGIVVRSIEARIGQVRLDRLSGLYEHVPAYASFFLVTGMASVGFPGTFGFFASEMLVDATVKVYPRVGIIIVLATALNGIAVYKAYARIFGGARRETTLPIGMSASERGVILLLLCLNIGGGIFPQPGVNACFEIAQHLFAARIDRPGHDSTESTPADRVTH